MLIRFTPEADADLTEAREWYSHQRAGLDLEFMDCLDEALSRVVRNPQSLFTAILGASSFAAFPSLSSTN